MMRQYELTERVLAYDPDADEALLNRAYVYAYKMHDKQIRRNGDPYFSHPIEVAAILTDLKLDAPTIATALLHDVIEDTPATRADIDRIFGAEIGQLVDGLTKINKLDLVSKKTEQAENFRKLLLAISDDIRVLLVKLADRLHNMRTLMWNSAESQVRNATETLEVFAPLAGLMGIQTVRDELEDLSFRYLEPKMYETVTAKLADLRVKAGPVVEEITEALKSRLAAQGIVADVSGREKRAYSVWRKMENKQIGLEQLSDIYAFRVLVEKEAECYGVLGVAHTAWRVVPGRFKDYISAPKRNNYRSLHTTIIGPRDQRVEMQIRTHTMHRVADYGVAAHAVYKAMRASNGAASPVPMIDDDAGAGRNENPYVQLRQIVDQLRDGTNSEEFLENTKLELFQDQVFCFTPKGRIIALPRGATPIDFAYAVHTTVGNRCVGALVNGIAVPVTTTQLRNGNEVTILTAANGNGPPQAWERFCVTGRARTAIRRAARENVKRQFADFGHRLLQAGFADAELDLTDDKLRRALPRLGHKLIDDVYAAVGRNELPIADVMKAVHPQAEPKRRLPARLQRNGFEPEHGWVDLAPGTGLKFKVDDAVDVEALEPVGTSGAQGLALAPTRRVVPIRSPSSDGPIKFEPGGAVPGDRIVGVLVPGEGIRIFQIHAPKLQSFEGNEWIDVAWDIDPNRPERFRAHISVTALNQPGSLAQIAQVIGEADGNIDTMTMKKRAADFTEMLFDIEVWDLKHLNEIIAGLRAKTVVSQVERLFA